MRQQVYSKETYAIANKKNKELFRDYMVELKAKKRKPSTIKQYEQDGRMLICYIKEEMEDKYFLDFVKKDFRDLALWLTEDRGISNARFNAIFAFIHGMMEYAEDEDDYQYDKNYARKVKNLPKDPVKEIVFLSDVQVLKIRNHLLEQKLYHHCAFLDIAYDSSARIGEIAQVTKENLIDRRYTNVVVGKRGKRFPLILHNRSVESIKLWLAQRGDDDIDSLWVTTRTKKRKLGKDAMYRWTKEMSAWLSKEEGKEINFSPHSLRHSALQNYRDGTHYMCYILVQTKKFEIPELQILARHDSMDTTIGYLKPMENDMIEKMFNIKVE